jgi:hypothetical protein
MFSPVKKELPSHLPLPPTGVVMSSQQFHQRPTDLSAYPQTNSAMTMHDLITTEIERSLAGNNGSGSKPYHSEYRGAAGPFSGLPSAAGGSRMSQVIEESLRGGGAPAARAPAATKDLEGLACPRTKSPFGTRSDASGRSNGGDRGHEFPVEGLAARFGHQRAPYNWQHPAQEGQSGYSRGYGGHPYPEGYPRKRSPPPTQMSPVLPPKKQHFDHPEFRPSKGKNNCRNVESISCKLRLY